jgi:hypothetical protein
VIRATVTGTAENASIGATDLRWSVWTLLRDASRAPEVPSALGLYRIRRSGFDGLDYIGQTGDGSTTLLKRLAM